MTIHNKIRLSIFHALLFSPLPLDAKPLCDASGSQLQLEKGSVRSSSTDTDATMAACVFEDECLAKIKITDLCARKIKAACIESDQLETPKLCADLLSGDDLYVLRACLGALQVNTMCADNLRVNNLEYCTSFRATAVCGAETLYRLGDPINFDVILEDPHSTLSNSLPFTTYTVPRSGSYLVAVQIDQGNLQTSCSILGAPIAAPSIWVNGIKYRENFSTYMSFNTTQNSHLTVLLSLKAGDIVSVHYNLYEFNGGLIPVVGTVDLQGNGTENAGTLFKIQALSTDCSDGPLCQSCSPTMQRTQCSSFRCY